MEDEKKGRGMNRRATGESVGVEREARREQKAQEKRLGTGRVDAREHGNFSRRSQIGASETS